MVSGGFPSRSPRLACYEGSGRRRLIDQQPGSFLVHAGFEEDKSSGRVAQATPPKVNVPQPGPRAGGRDASTPAGGPDGPPDSAQHDKCTSAS
jgi:hypothetical protein